MNSVWGIDLGTTNSCVSRLEAGRPTAIPIDGSEIVPSVVMFTAEGVVVGRKAQNLELSAPESCVRSVKRRMGRGPNYTVSGQTYSPEQISAEILRALKRGAEKFSGEPVRDVVITVPAYFDDVQRRATIQAGELAGLNVLRLLNEPTSASLIYDQVQRADQSGAPEIVMVYDLGGGTFDVSVLEVFGGVREVRATAGNTQLGGDDFDELLYRRFADQLKLTRSVDLGADARARAKLRNLAERTKVALSTTLEQRVREEFVAVDTTGAPVHLDLTVTRAEFEAQLHPLLALTIELSRRAVDDAKLAPDETISRICLVGGSTRIPAVHALLTEAFPNSELHEEISPDLAVALGASVQAGMLAGQRVERVLVDVAAHTLGILVLGEEDDGWDRPDTFAPVLRRNTVLPSEQRERFATIVDEQGRLSVEVFQGEAKRASENRLVGNFDFPLEQVPAGSPIDVAFAYDLDGVVRVTISQPGTHNQKTVQLRLADASELGVDTPVLRKARVIAASLEDDDRGELERLIKGYEAAVPSAREEAEEALLDFLVELDSSDEDA